MTPNEPSNLKPEATNEHPPASESITTSSTETKPGQKKKKSWVIGISLLLILSCLLIFFVIRYGRQISNDNPIFPGNSGSVVDGELALMDYEEIKAELQSKVDESYMNLKMNLNPVFNGIDGLGNLFIQNSASNPSNIQVRIYLEDTDNLIYMSPIVKPNQSIPEDYLTYTDGLEPGTYNCLAMFSILDPETNTVTSETGIKINLIIL